MAAAAPAVLVVEDEPLVRMEAVDMLSELHVASYEAEDADEALFMLAGHPGIAVLFADINLPGGMDGVELASRVHSLRPEVGIIMTSGRYGKPDAAMPDQGTFLPKPYSSEQLQKAVELKLAGHR